MNGKNNEPIPKKSPNRGNGFIKGGAGNAANFAGRAVAWYQFIAAVIVGFILIGIGIYLTQQEEKVMKQTTGIVTNVTGPILQYSGSGRNRKAYNEWTVSYTYSLPLSEVTSTVPGTHYPNPTTIPENEDETGDEIYKGLGKLRRQVNVGDTINVYYNVNSPRESSLNKPYSPKLVGGALICVGISGILIYSIILYFVRRNKTLSQMRGGAAAAGLFIGD